MHQKDIISKHLLKWMNLDMTGVLMDLKIKAKMAIGLSKLFIIVIDFHHHLQVFWLDQGNTLDFKQT